MSNPENSEQQVPSGAHEIDYRESMDVTQVHAAIEREKKDPWTNFVPVPLWLMSLFAIVLCWGSFYFGMFSGFFSASIYNESAGAVSGGKKNGPAGEAVAPETPVEAGRKVFAQNCQVCHQPTGMGIPGQYPPLAKSEFINGGAKRPVMILLKGLQGPLKVEGGTFNGAMPTWTSLTNKQIAYVLTYVRQEWGNKADEINPEQVATARKEFKERTEPWTEAEILAVPADASLEGGAPAAAPAAKPAAPEEKK